MALRDSKTLKAMGLGLLVAAALSAPQAAMAQAADGESPWIKMCGTDPNNNKDFCLVVQELRAETGQFIASVQLRQYKGDDKVSLIAAVPPGMAIQPGMRAQIDGGKQYELPYDICFPNACYGRLDVNKEFVDSMKAGGQLSVSALNQGQKVVTFPLTLIGFTKVYDSEGMDAAGAEARQNELNAALQARAAAARQKLIEQQQQQSSGN